MKFSSSVNRLSEKIYSQQAVYTPIGEFLLEEISGPLDANVLIGVKDHELPRIAKGKVLGFGYQFMQSLIPARHPRHYPLRLVVTWVMACHLLL